MKQILIATDLSQHAARAAEHGVALARMFGARVELLTSVSVPAMALYPGSIALPPGAFEGMQRQAREELEAQAASLRESGVEIECRLATTSPSAAICERASEIGADLIAMGTRGLAALPHALLGSTAERVARLAPCPVLTAHADSPPPRDIRAILVPTDFSTHADAALDWARPLVEQTGARLILMHSYHVPRGLEADVLELDERVSAAVGDAVEQRLAPFRAGGARETEFVLKRDLPDVAALEAASEGAADLIVIGTRGRTGLPHAILGSVAERIIRRAEAPVVSLKAADEDTGR